eukprot:UN30792
MFPESTKKHEDHYWMSDWMAAFLLGCFMVPWAWQIFPSCNFDESIGIYVCSDVECNSVGCFFVGYTVANTLFLHIFAPELATDGQVIHHVVAYSLTIGFVKMDMFNYQTLYFLLTEGSTILLGIFMLIP